jgi:CRISPR-associated protein Csx10
MTLRYITITPKSPIRIGEAKPNFSFLSTNNIIPGSVVRGAVAEYLISNGREAQIKSLIDGMRFGFLYPTSKNIFPLPLPTTAHTCKAKKGFKGEKEAHGVFDSLLAMIAFYELENLNAKFPVPFTFKCQECESRMDKFIGFYVKEKNYEEIELEKFSQTKVAINRWRKTAGKEMLYSITAIKPKCIFIGKIFGNDANIEEVVETLNEVGLGSHTSKGYGKVEAKKADIKIEKLESRVQSFNEKLKEMWKDVLSIALNKNELPNEPQYTYFSIDLLSPTILKKDGIPTLKLSVNLKEREIEPILFSASSTFIGGWSTAWGLPKETTYGAGIGSTYVFKLNVESKELYQHLERIELDGVGEKRDEGYGDVLICHPFHREVTPI